MAKKSFFPRFAPFILSGVLLIIVIGLAVYISQGCDNTEQSTQQIKATNGRVSETSGIYENAAASTDSSVCSSLAVRVLAEGGNAVDGAIVAGLCSGVQNIHSCGIGGGSFMMLYDQKTDLHKFINCRETAPAAATGDMYVNNTASAQTGGLAIAVPGEMACYALAHDKYGKADWKYLINLIIELVEEGVMLTNTQQSPVQTWGERITNNEMFTNSDGRIKQVGDQILNQKLADTFKIIAEDKWSFHTGTLVDDIIADITEEGGIVSRDDLATYTADELDAVSFDIENYRVYVPPPPASGVILAFIVNLMANFRDKNELNLNNNTDYHHKLIESYKFAYAKRSLLGDPLFQEDADSFDELVKNLTSYEYATSIVAKITEQTHNFSYYEPVFDIVEDAGTSHFNVIDADGMAVSMTSTINTWYGSKVLGKRTGIMFNNEMDDFSTPGLINAFGVPPSPANFIEPGKRPLSSMTPIIIVDKTTKEVKFLAGASGGTRITSSTADVTIRALLFDQELNKVVQAPRLHHQLIPDTVQTEFRVDQDLVEGLEQRGHTIAFIESTAVVQAVKRNEDGTLTAVSDIRKGGKPDGY